MQECSTKILGTYFRTKIKIYLIYSKETQRISHLSDIEYLGENIPFYNNNEKKVIEDDESTDKKSKSKEVEFFPNKDVVMTRSPKWTIPNPNKIVKCKDDNFLKKIEDTRKSWENRRIKFIDDVALSYFKVYDGKKGSFKYHKVRSIIHYN
jgi:hypothetical protein